MNRPRKCSHCGGLHPDDYHTEKRITDKGFPTHNKNYLTAHEEATKAEKSKFPRKDYNQLKKMDKTVPKHELIGKNTKSGKIEVSRKVPKKLRDEVAFHEKTENEILMKRKKIPLNKKSK